MEPAGTIVDQVVIYSLKPGEAWLDLGELFKASPLPTSFKQVNPALYEVHVSSRRPFLLTLAYAYHPLWRAYVNGKEYKPIVGYSFTNTFKIDEEGELNITLRYLGQDYTNMGLMVSLTTLLASTTYLAVSTRKGRKPKS